MAKVSKVNIDKIVEIFQSDMFENDVYDKIDHIQWLGSKKTTEQLLEIYDNLEDYL